MSDDDDDRKNPRYKFLYDCKDLNDPQKVREKCVSEWFIPVCKAMLEKEEECNSVTIALAQYYSDNAEDEVHVKFLPSSIHNPDWESTYSKENIFYQRDFQEYADESGYWDTFDYGREESKALLNDWYPYLGADFFVDAFDRYCKEGCSEETNDKDSYQPYLIVYKDKETGDVKIREIGDLVRIWS